MGRSFPIPGTPELRDGHGLVEFSHCTEDLADEFRGWRVVLEGGGTISGNQLDAAPLEHGVPDLLHHEVTREATGGLDDDGPNAVPFDPLQHVPEARAGV